MDLRQLYYSDTIPPKKITDGSFFLYKFENKFYRKILQKLLIRKIGPQKIRLLQICIVLFFFFFFLIQHDAYKIMVGCPSCSYPSIHLVMALTLKITAYCPSCTDPSIIVGQNLILTSWTPWSEPQKNWEPWARPPVLTPVPSQAIHSSPPIAVGSRRVTLPRNLHTRFDSFETLLRNWHTHVGLLGPCSVKNKDKE